MTTDEQRTPRGYVTGDPADLERLRRDLEISRALCLPGSPGRVLADSQIAALDAQARRVTGGDDAS